MFMLKKESGEIYHHVSQPFQMLEQEAQELFLTNFKKVLTGHLDTKLFELKFRRDVEDSTQTILFEGLQVDINGRLERKHAANRRENVCSYCL